MAIGERSYNDLLGDLVNRIDPRAFQQLIPLSSGELTMMFTDIVDSTRVKATVGDGAYFDMLDQRHHPLIRACIRESNGRELKTIGDAFLAVFGDPNDAARCAVSIQK